MTCITYVSATAISRSICAAMGFFQGQPSLLCHCCMVQLVPQSSRSVLEPLALDLHLRYSMARTMFHQLRLISFVGDRIPVVCSKELNLALLPEVFPLIGIFCAKKYLVSDMVKCHSEGLYRGNTALVVSYTRPQHWSSGDIWIV